MSSTLRTIQKRILKKMGYTRQTQRVEVLNGVPRIVALKRGEGDIIRGDGESVGRRWPAVLPAAETADRQTPRKGAPRGSRRGTHKRPFRQAFYTFA